MRKFLSILLTALLIFACAVPVIASAQDADVSVTAEQTTSAEDQQTCAEKFKSYFTDLFDKIKALFERLKAFFQVKNEKVECTMNKNAIHMLRSTQDTICDSFIITTEDGKVIAIDGGHRFETDYFIEYLKSATGRCKPHIDAWFLSHPHDDHCEVFLEVAENHADEVTFDKVYANFPDAEFYEGYDSWAVAVITDFNRLRPAFEDKVVELAEGDVFNVGAAKFTVFYTFNPEWKNANEASTIMRMDLAGTGVMWNGDAGTSAGDYVVNKYASTGLLDCDYCKMAHHGQDGVGENFYRAVSPEVCIWPTPTWVYENTNGNLHTFETREWVQNLGVETEYKSFEGSCVIGMKPRIVTTTDVFEDGYPADVAIDRLARLGYEGIDMGFDYWIFEGSPFLADDYLEWARDLREHAAEVGIPYTHAHAPGEADDDDWIKRSIEAAAVLGARYLVIHPIFQTDGKTINGRLKFISVNKKAIEKWLPLAEERGVVLLSENILWGASSDPRAIAELVKSVDSPYFGWCFDVGHAWSCGYAPDIIKKCCVAPLSLHIQDNHGNGDEHLIPGDGTIDFDLFIAALKDVGYLGDCVLEAHHQSLDAPDEERDGILSRLMDVAEELREKMR